jgi:hypothetical protein
MKKDLERFDACQHTLAEFGSSQILIRFDFLEVCFVTQVPCSKTAEMAGAMPPSKLLSALDALLGRPATISSLLMWLRALEVALDGLL